MKAALQGCRKMDIQLVLRANTIRVIEVTAAAAALTPDQEAPGELTLYSLRQAAEAGSINVDSKTGAVAVAAQTERCAGQVHQ